MSSGTTRRISLIRTIAAIAGVGVLTLAGLVTGVSATAAPPVVPGTADYFGDQPTPADFSPSGTWTVPPGVTSVTVKVTGGSGSTDIPGRAAGGTGAVVTGDLAVAPGDVLSRQIGADGTAGVGGQGYGAGGTGAGSCGVHAGGGGGSSALLVGSEVVVVAGGGGGGGFQAVARSGTGVGGDADIDNAGSGNASPGALGQNDSASGGDGDAGTNCAGGGGGGGGGPVLSTLSGGGTGGGAGSSSVGSAGGGGGGVSFTGPALTNALVHSRARIDSGDPGVKVSFGLRVTLPAGLTVEQILAAPDQNLPIMSVAGCLDGDTPIAAEVETFIRIFLDSSGGSSTQLPVALQLGGFELPGGIMTVSFVPTIVWLEANSPGGNSELVLDVRCAQSGSTVTIVIPHGGTVGVSPPAATGPQPGVTPEETPEVTPQLADTGADSDSVVGGILISTLLVVVGAVALLVSSRRRQVMRLRQGARPLQTLSSWPQSRRRRHRG